MVDTKWNRVEQGYIQEISNESLVVLSLTHKIPLKAYNQALDQIMKIASTKKKSSDQKMVNLRLQYFLEEKWEYTFRKLSTSPNLLANIDYLDFQHSEFSVSMLYDLNTLYCKAKSMEELPNIFLIHCPVAFEAKSLIESFESDKVKGIQFLKKLCMYGNKHCEDTAKLPTKW